VRKPASVSTQENRRDNNNVKRRQFMRTGVKSAFRSTVALLLALICGTVAAQNETTRLVVQVSQLKPDMVDEWREAQSDVNAALKEAGATTRTVLETMFGDRPEFVSIRPLPSFAEYDGEGLLQQALGEREAAALIARIQACEVSNVRSIVNRQNEFTVGDVTAPVRTTVTYRVNSGGADAYRDFVREQLLPLNQKAVADGLIAGYGVSITGQGSPEPGLWNHTTYRANMAALDAPGLAGQVLGEAAADNLGAAAGRLRTIVRVVVRRRVPELSF
jgi:hypothetical protein